MLVVAVLLLLLAAFAYHHRLGIAQRYRHSVLGLHTPPPGVLNVGQRLPAVQFTALDGSRAPIVVKPGRVLYLDVFTTWCPDCIKETPALEQLRQATAGQPVDIIAIDQQEDAATVNAFIQRQGLTFPVYIDEESITQSAFGVRYIPVAYIIDGSGIVLAHVIGPQSLDEMKRLVDDALHGRRVGLGG